MSQYKVSPLLKRNLSKVAMTAVIWYISTMIFLFLEKGVLGDLEYYPSTGNKFDFNNSIIYAPLFSLIAGTILGLIEIFWLSKQFRNLTFGQKIVLKTLFYLIAILFATMLGTAVANSSSLNKSLLSDEVVSSVLKLMSDFAFVSIIVYIGFTLIINLFLLEVSDNLGQGVLLNFITGRYHHPREEKRIFMFLDLKSSTTIAEELGHDTYFSWLNDYYNHITESIIKSYGSIYQYVGDEVVISWPKEDGVRNLNCIKCFFKCKAEIEINRHYYKEKYGYIPRFKAGMHVGTVTTGEIGSVKKEIVYTGDVLNTTARIQSLCNNYDEELLISETLRVELSGLDSNFLTNELGEVKLRGRNESIKLFGIKQFSEHNDAKPGF